MSYWRWYQNRVKCTFSIVMYNMKIKVEKKNLLDQDWTDHAVVFAYRDMVMNQWSTEFLFEWVKF